RSPDMFNAVRDIAEQVGFTKKTFEACLKNQALFDGLNAEKDRASNSFGVDSTPTFFIDGKKQSGALTIEQLDEQIQPLL
ncbi:MAG: DsbA family protein, partial [Alphaproteobacteria bacterium]